MNRICAWCGKSLPESAAQGPEGMASHGMCQDCEARMAERTGESLGEFLDRVDVPILLSGGDGSIVSANKQARELVDKDLPAIEGSKSGDVLECVHSKEPGGCGNTVHCRSCTIRLTVLDTYKTGKTHHGVKAYPDIETGSGVKRMRFLISTQKVGNAVLLRIDEAGVAPAGDPPPSGA